MSNTKHICSGHITEAKKERERERKRKRERERENRERERERKREREKEKWVALPLTNVCLKGQDLLEGLSWTAKAFEIAKSGNNQPPVLLVAPDYIGLNLFQVCLAVC